MCHTEDVTLYAEAKGKNLSSSAEWDGVGRNVPGKGPCLSALLMVVCGGEIAEYTGGEGVTETGRNGPGAAVSEENTHFVFTRTPS